MMSGEALPYHTSLQYFQEAPKKEFTMLPLLFCFVMKCYFLNLFYFPNVPCVEVAEQIDWSIKKEMEKTQSDQYSRGFDDLDLWPPPWPNNGHGFLLTFLCFPGNG